MYRRRGLLFLFLLCVMLFAASIFVIRQYHIPVTTTHGNQGTWQVVGVRQEHNTSRRHHRDDGNDDTGSTYTTTKSSSSSSWSTTTFMHNQTGEVATHNDLNGTTMATRTTTTPRSSTLNPPPLPACRPKCQRVFISVHKMGYQYGLGISQDAFRGDGVKHTRIINHQSTGMHAMTIPRTEGTDYRHVLMTRDIPSALISGYFYHQTGRECWLDWNGNSKHKNGMDFQGWLFHQDWETPLLENHAANNANSRPPLSSSLSKQVFPWPPGNGRNLCAYLQDESPRNGFRVYVEWAYLTYLKPLMEFYNERLERESKVGYFRTLHVCYEDVLENYETSIDAFIKHFDLKEDTIPGKRASQFTLEQRTGGANIHGTAKNMTVTEELMTLLHELDEKLFNGTLTEWNNKLGCGVVA